MPKTSLTSLDDEFNVILALEKTPTLSQRDLASVLGFSVGKVNYCLKALIDKGLIKAGRFAQNPNKAQYAYLLTPQGIASKAALTAHFLERKMTQYESLKREIAALQPQVPVAEATQVASPIKNEHELLLNSIKAGAK